MHSATWRLRPGLALRHRSWDQEEFVLYNNLSGDTHLADAATIEILTMLQVQPHSLEGLAGALQLDHDADTLASLDGLLRELQGLALVDAGPC